MKKTLVLFVSLLLCANLYVNNAFGQGKIPTVTRNFSASSIKGVDVSTSGGSITVNGHTGSEAVVEVFASPNNLRGNWSDERIKQTLDENYILDIKLEGGVLYALAKPKNNMNWTRAGLSIAFVISVPQQVNSNLRTSGGSIKINNLSGIQDFSTSGGSLTLGHLSGKITGKTSGGSITLTDSGDDIDLKTSGGSITARDCRGNISLKTSGGSLKMDNLDGNIQATTSGGSITANKIKGSLKTGTSGGSVRLNGISGNVDAHTSGGSMTVDMESVSEYIKLSNSGNLSLSLPSGKGYNLKARASKIETSGLKDFSGSMDNKSIDGTVGRGGPQVELKSSNRISLKFE